MQHQMEKKSDNDIENGFILQFIGKITKTPNPKPFWSEVLLYSVPQTDMAIAITLAFV